MKGTPIEQEIKELITQRVKQGEDLNKLAKEFSISPTTIRKWLAQDGVSGVLPSGRNQRSTALLLARAEKEKQDLIAIIGELTIQVKELSKKKSR